MRFNKEYMEKKTNQFWDAYFKVVESRRNRKGEFVEKVKRWERIPIDNRMSLDFNWIQTVVLIDTFLNIEMATTRELDICTAALELLPTYLDSVVYDHYEED